MPISGSIGLQKPYNLNNMLITLLLTQVTRAGMLILGATDPLLLSLLVPVPHPEPTQCLVNTLITLPLHPKHSNGASRQAHHQPLVVLRCIWGI